VHVAMYEQAASNILATMSKSAPELTASCTFFKDVSAFFNEHIAQDGQLAHLDELLKSDTFTKGSEKEFALFFRRGNMLCAYYLLSKIKQKFEAMMAGIG